MNPARLLHGDCLDHMARLPDASVNLLLCDLPYGGSKTGFGWDSRIDLEAFWREVRRVLHPKGVVVAFATQPFSRRPR